MHSQTIAYGFWFYHELLDKFTFKREKVLFHLPDGSACWINTGSSRIKCLARSPICVFCKVEGVIWILESIVVPGQILDPPHFGLYAIGKWDNLILMTQDHILPRSRGGTYVQQNLQTACSRCNGKRGDTPMENYK